MGVLRIQDVIRKGYAQKTFLRGTRYCRAIYFNEQQATLNSQQVLLDDSHPFFPRISKLYTTRDPQSLWWGVYSGLNVSPNATIRNWCRRRMGVAFREALRQQGYDRHGKALGNGEGGGVHCEPGFLFGSLDIHINPNMIAEKYFSVHMEASRILDGVVKKVVERKKSISNVAHARR